MPTVTQTSKRLLASLAAVLLVLAGAPAQKQRVPERLDLLTHNAAADLHAYVTKAHEVLLKLDRLMDDDRYAIKRHVIWKANAESVLDYIQAKQKRLVELRRGRTSDELAAYNEALKWYGQERAQWTRILSAGLQIISTHDRIVDTTIRLRKEEIVKLLERRGQYAGLAKVADVGIRLLERLETNPDRKMLLQLLREMDNGTRAAAIELLAESLRADVREIAKLKKLIDPAPWRKRTRELNDLALAKEDEPRYRYYREHEKKWEVAMKRHMEEFREAHAEWEKVSANLITAPFKGAARALQEAVRDPRVIERRLLAVREDALTRLRELLEKVEK